MNRYYILNINRNQLSGLLNNLGARDLEITVGDFGFTRFNNSDTKCIFKTKRYITEVPNFLKVSEAYSHSEILEVLKEVEWVNTII